MRVVPLRENDIPTFCWDRGWTVSDIRTRIRDTAGMERLRLIAWVLREGTFNEIWNIVAPSQVFAVLSELLPYLGRRKDYWRYTFDVWHRLGKV